MKDNYSKKDDKPLAHRKVEEFLADTSLWDEISQTACVLIADLVGSTEFKRDHSIPEGLAKTLLHNKVASEQITRFKGSIVKYLGDGVMGTFIGEDRVKNGIEAGLAIIEGIERANEGQRWSFPKAMSTKIGVHDGKVWMFQYPVSVVEDPQGTTVDIAARLSSMAGPQQVVCAQETYTAGGGESSFPNATEIVKRYVKGINQPLELRVVAPVGRNVVSVALEGHSRETAAPLQKDLQDAIRLRNERRSQEALEKFNKIIVTENGNFHANLYAADLLIQGIAEDDPEILKKLVNITEYLCRAKWARPHSSRVWLLISWVRSKEYEISRNKESLDRAIWNAKQSLDCAEDGLNRGGSIQAKTCLANYLWRRWKDKCGDVSQDLTEANRLCGEVAVVIDVATSKHRLEYLVTHAFIRLGLPNEDYDQVEAMIEEALKIDPYSVRAIEAKKELIRLRNRRTCETPFI